VSDVLKAQALLQQNPAPEATLRRMSAVELPPEQVRLSTGVKGLDVCLAESDESAPGLPLGTSVLLSGMPGGGKSTIALYAAAATGSADSLILYGEEREENVRRRWDRLGLPTVGGDPFLCPLDSAEDALDVIRSVKPLITIVDSVQTLSLEGKRRYDDQYQAVKLICGQAAAAGGSVIFVSHVTKGGKDPAGSQGLPHLVDVHIHVAVNSKKAQRDVEIRKNRCGRAGFRVPLTITNKALVCGQPVTLEDGSAGSNNGEARNKLEQAAQKAYELLLAGETLTAYDADKAGMTNLQAWRAGLELAARHCQRDGYEVEEVKVGLRKAYRLEDPPNVTKPEPEPDGMPLELHEAVG
jgi:hypothetical protein